MKKNFMPSFEVRGIGGIAFGLLIAIVTMLLLSFIATMVVYFSPLPESALVTIAIIINVIAILLGGFFAGRKASSKGFLHGLAVGAIVLVIMLILGGVTLGSFIIQTLYCLLAGTIGGIFGIK